MENKISTRQEEEFRNKKFQDKKNKTDSIKETFKANKKFQTSTMPEKHTTKEVSETKEGNN